MTQETDVNQEVAPAPASATTFALGAGKRCKVCKNGGKRLRAAHRKFGGNLPFRQWLKTFVTGPKNVKLDDQEPAPIADVARRWLYNKSAASVSKRKIRWEKAKRRKNHRAHESRSAGAAAKTNRLPVYHRPVCAINDIRTW